MQWNSVTRGSNLCGLDELRSNQLIVALGELIVIDRSGWRAARPRDALGDERELRAPDLSTCPPTGKHIQDEPKG